MSRPLDRSRRGFSILLLLLYTVLFIGEGVLPPSLFAQIDDSVDDLEGNYSSLHPYSPPVVVKEVSEIVINKMGSSAVDANWGEILDGLVIEIAEDFRGEGGDGSGYVASPPALSARKIRAGFSVAFEETKKGVELGEGSNALPDEGARSSLSDPSLAVSPVKESVGVSEERRPSPLPDNSRSTLVTSIEFASKEGRSEVIIVTDSPVQYSTILLSNPDRLVLDLEGARFSPDLGSIEVRDEIVKGIRFGQFKPEVARIVMDLTSSAGYNIFTSAVDSRKLIVAFNLRVKDLSYNGGDTPSIDIYTSGHVEYTSMVLRSPDRIVLDLHETTLVTPVRNVPVNDGIIREVRIDQFDSHTVRMVVDLFEPIAYRILRPADQDGLLRVAFKNSLRNVGVTRVEDGSVIVMEGNGRLEPSVTFDEDSKRLLVNLPDAVMDSQMKVIVVGDGLVDRITAIQADNMTVQLAVALTSYVGHEVKRGGRDGEVILEVFNSPVKGRVIAIDPGHGGIDSGAVGPTGLFEKTVNLDIARRVERLLRLAGARVFLTRNDDSYLYLPRRVEMVHNAGADIFVSIHSNGFTQYYPSGTEAYYYSNPRESEKLARYIHGNLVKDLGLIDRGIKRKDLYVLKDNAMPSVLIEVAFITNAEEERLLKDPQFREKVAQSIYRGILQYFSGGE